MLRAACGLCLGVWLAPLALFVFEKSVWAMGASVVLVASVAGLWDFARYLWRKRRPTDRK